MSETQTHNQYLNADEIPDAGSEQQYENSDEFKKRILESKGLRLVSKLGQGAFGSVWKCTTEGPVSRFEDKIVKEYSLTIPCSGCKKEQIGDPFFQCSQCTKPLFSLCEDCYIKEKETPQHPTFHEYFCCRSVVDQPFVAVKFVRHLKHIASEISLMACHTGMFVMGFRGFIPEINGLLMQYAENGSIDDWLRRQTQPIDWKLRFKWATQLARAIEYLHHVDVIHRDIRCANVLLTKDLNILISDFGVSKWRNRSARNPAYYCGHDIYSESLTEHTLDKPFDLRLYGIVLARLLSFGSQLDAQPLECDKLELEENNDVRLPPGIECDNDDYWQLIRMCFVKGTTMEIVHDYIRLIGEKYFVKLDPWAGSQDLSSASKEVQEEVPKALESLKDPTKHFGIASKLEELKVKDQSLFEALLHALHNTTGAITVRQSLSAAITKAYSPREFLEALSRCKDVHKVGPKGVEQPEELVEGGAVEETIQTLLKSDDMIARYQAAQNLGAKENVNDEAVLYALIRCLSEEPEEFVRSRGAQSLFDLTSHA